MQDPASSEAKTETAELLTALLCVLAVCRAWSYAAGAADGGHEAAGGFDDTNDGRSTAAKHAAT